MNQLKYNAQLKGGGLLSSPLSSSGGLLAGAKGLMAGLLGEATGKLVYSKDINSSVTKFMYSLGNGMVEMQCFSSLSLSCLIKTPGEDSEPINLSPYSMAIPTWTSMSMPPPTVQFKSDPSTLYKPTFAGLTPSTLMTVGYQDFVLNSQDASTLRYSSVLWEMYAAQFTNLGYFIKGFKLNGVKFSPTITYNFYATYRFGEKDFSEVPLWQVIFDGVVLTEPQVNGISPTMGNMNRSFSFMYESYKIVLNNAFQQ